MKHLKFIAGFSALAFACALVPTMASADQAFTPTVSLYASLAETYTKAKTGDTNMFAPDTSSIGGSYYGMDQANFLTSNSYVGFKFNSDKIQAEVQAWAKPNCLQVYWAEYDAGIFKLFAGQKDPMYTQWTNQAAYGLNNMGGYGVAWSGREKQIKLSIGGFYIDVMPSNRIGSNVDGTVYANDQYIQTIFPKTNIGYQTKIGNSSINFGGVADYTTYSSKSGSIQATNTSTNGLESNGDIDVNNENHETNTISSSTTTATPNLNGKDLYAWMVYANANIVAGSVTVLLTADGGLNEGNLGMWNENSIDPWREACWNGSKFKDTTTYEGAAEIMNNFGTFSLGAGAGYVHSENSTWENVYKGKEQDLMSCYVEGIVPIGKNITLYPEVSYFCTLKDAKTNAFGEQSVWAGVVINYSI
jgi:hypothetical protein